MRKVKYKLEPYRIAMGGNMGDENNGAFLVKSPKDRETLAILISDGFGWEHVSVSRKDRTPTWEEMCFVKDLVFDDEEVVVQYHPPKSEYVNNHPYCLHMWRLISKEMPRPLKHLVGIK